MGPQPDLDSQDVERVLRQSDAAGQEAVHSDFFYRQLALFMAKEATLDFRARNGPADVEGAEAIASYVEHETQVGRLPPGEIQTAGQGFRIQANVHNCTFEGSCRGNLKALGEVPQCLRAITLIEAMTAKIPDRPPMTYDLKPGLVDRTSESCELQIRPAGIPAPEPVDSMVAPSRA